MDTTTSPDGTPIAYTTTGEGDTVVIVNGALSRAADAAELAEALAEHGYRAVTWDRRGRGDSGDAPGSTPDREVEDLAAVIDAVGGAAAVLGHSSGAALSLYAASLGVPVGALFLSEPPTRFGVDEPPADLAARLQALVDAGEGEEAVAAFQRDAVGLPDAMIEQFRAGGMLTAIAPLAQSTVYDVTLMDQVSTPTEGMLSVAVPVTVLRGEQTFPMLIVAADRLADEIDQAELVVVPESVMHRADPAATARVVADRLG